jgi:hypothetical protein
MHTHIGRDQYPGGRVGAEDKERESEEKLKEDKEMQKGRKGENEGEGWKKKSVMRAENEGEGW